MDERHLPKAPPKVIAARRSREPEIPAHRPARIQGRHREERPETEGEPVGSRKLPASATEVAATSSGRRISKGKKIALYTAKSCPPNTRVNTFQPTWERHAIQM
jgi:hypothetical protein